MRTLSLFLISVLTFMSCEDRRAFEIDSHVPQVVLNSIISTDSIWSVTLNYTKSITDKGNFRKISDASVKVINLTNGQSFFLEEKANGDYCRELNPVEGHEYELSIDIPNEDIVRASTYVPSVLDVEVLSQAQIDENGDPSLEIDIAIIDNPEEENFYVWDLRPYQAEESNELPVINPSSEIPSVITKDKSERDNQIDDPFLNLPEIKQENKYQFVKGNGTSLNETTKTRSFNSSTYLSDKNAIKGKIHNRLYLNKDILEDIDVSEEVIVVGSGTEGLAGKKPIFQLNVRAVSSELFEYLQTYESYRQNNVVNTSIVAPSEVFSNIENGTGIFGGYNLKTFNIY